MGLFHMQMQLLTLLFRSHGCENKDQFSPSSLFWWMKELRRDGNMWEKNKVKFFDPADALFNHVLDGHILAALANTLGVEDVDKLEGAGLRLAEGDEADSEPGFWPYHRYESPGSGNVGAGCPVGECRSVPAARSDVSRLWRSS
jgi:hypothetical protein